MPEPLRLDGVSLHYGSLRAVDDVSFALRSGERHALIGPNGAGKSTLLAVIAGSLRSTRGRILVAGQDVTRSSEHRRARLGVAKTFQHSSVFLGLSVLDNVALAAQPELGLGRRWFSSARRFGQLWQRAYECLDAVDLGDRAQDLARSLSHGERRQLEVAVALAGRPRLLLLDEPTAGMSAAESASFVRLVRSLPEQVTVLLIEHDLDVVFQLATVVSVLHLGRLIASGPPEQVRESDAVQEAYLGAAQVGDLFMDEGA